MYNYAMNITQEFDTITAIATPIGTGGVGVIRISGSKSFEIAEKIFTGKIETGKISHGWITDNEIKIDEVILLTFKNPNSYTGEDIIEIQCHGGINVVKNILDRSIGSSTPFSTYRGRQMHHTLRYGKHKMLRVYTYGSITPDEKKTFEFMAERNAINYGYEQSEVIVLESLRELEEMFKWKQCL